MRHRARKIGRKDTGFPNVPIVVITVVLVVLKLAKVEPVAAWSWCWVLAPIVLSAAIGALFFLAAMKADERRREQEGSQ